MTAVPEPAGASDTARLRAAADEGWRLLGLDQPLPQVIQQGMRDLVAERAELRAALDQANTLAVSRGRAMQEAEATLDRVRALADFWEGTCDPEFPPSNVMDALFAVDQIRLVLAGGNAGPGGVRFAASGPAPADPDERAGAACDINPETHYCRTHRQDLDVAGITCVEYEAGS